MTTITEQILALRAMTDALLIAVQADGSGAKLVTLPKAGKAKAAKADKKPRANAGQGTAWSAFSSKIQKEHKDEIDVVKAAAAAKRKAAKEAGEEAPEDTKGPHLHWCSAYKEAHHDEWLAFKSAWEAEHPKGSRATSQANSDGESAEGEAAEGAKPKKRGAKKMSEMTEEERTIAKAKRAANKAAKAAAKAASEDEEAENFTMAPAAAVGGAGAPAAAAAPPTEEADDELELEEEEESLDKLIPFTHKKIKYLRYGHLDEDGEGVWWEGGDIWLQKEDGSKGAYAGQIQASGKIDISAEVMAAEPDIN